jgi:hypothetical protein
MHQIVKAPLKRICKCNLGTDMTLTDGAGVDGLSARSRTAAVIRGASRRGLALTQILDEQC